MRELGGEGVPWTRTEELQQLTRPRSGGQWAVRESTSDYADKSTTILALSKDEQLKLREKARWKAVAQFSEAKFDQGWMRARAALKRLTTQSSVDKQE